MKIIKIRRKLENKLRLLGKQFHSGPNALNCRGTNGWQGKTNAHENKYFEDY